MQSLLAASACGAMARVQHDFGTDQFNILSTLGEPYVWVRLNLATVWDSSTFETKMAQYLSNHLGVQQQWHNKNICAVLDTMKPVS